MGTKIVSRYWCLLLIAFGLIAALAPTGAYAEEAAEEEGTEESADESSEEESTESTEAEETDEDEEEEAAEEEEEDEAEVCGECGMEECVCNHKEQTFGVVRVNGEDVTITLSGDIRTRGESWQGTGFNKARARAANAASYDREARANFILSRARLNFDLTLGENLSARWTLQDSRQWGTEGGALGNVPPPAPGTNGDYTGSSLAVQDGDGQHTDTREIWVEYANIHGQDLSIRIGRQAFKLGNERYVGTFDWNNNGRSFDGAVLTHNLDGFLEASLFGFRIEHTDDDGYEFGAAYTSTPRATAYTKTTRHNATDRKLYGLNLDFTLLDGVGIEGSHHQNPFVLISADRRRIFLGEREVVAGNTDPSGSTVTLFGLRLNGDEMYGLDYNVEGVLHRGRVGSTPLRAYQVAFEFGYTVDIDLEPRVAVGYEKGSGDSNPVDGVNNTPVQLYPTNHGFYGWADQHSLRNLTDYFIEASVKTCDHFSVYAGWHFFKLTDSSDGWYTVGGPMIAGSSPDALTTANAAAGISDKVSRTLGSELDIKGVVTLEPDRLSLEIGWAHYFTGAYLRDSAFVRNTAGQARVNDLDFVYLQLSLGF
ncbi:MAG: alginate export family protein [Planctomycetes bacterium]|nr:alginate export family protein [Planctomycetota bacterium]